MNGFSVYQLFVSIKLHFQSDSYDYFKYHGQTRNSKKTFEKRNDQIFFNLMGEKYDDDELRDRILANVFYDPNVWIRDLNLDKGKEIYMKWQGNAYNFLWRFEKDLIDMTQRCEIENVPFVSLFRCSVNTHPFILRWLFMEEISYETFIELNRLMGFFKRFDKVLANDLIWSSLQKKCLNYSRFLDIIYLTVKQKEKARQIFKKVVLKQ